MATILQLPHVNPLLRNVNEPILPLQVFAQLYCAGQIAPSGKRVRADTEEQQLGAIGQRMQTLGADDPCHNSHGNIDSRLTRLISGYKHQDAAPNRVKPLPIQVLHCMVTIANASGNPESLSILHLWS